MFEVEVTGIETIYGREAVYIDLLFYSEPSYEDVLDELAETYDEIRAIDYFVTHTSHGMTE